MEEPTAYYRYIVTTVKVKAQVLKLFKFVAHYLLICQRKLKLMFAKYSTHITLFKVPVYVNTPTGDRRLI